MRIATARAGNVIGGGDWGADRLVPDFFRAAERGKPLVVRNVANLVPPFETGGDYHSTSAALEFAVQALRVKHIVVLGHGRSLRLR